VSKPVVLIAEELSPATVDALGGDFDIRQVDGTDRAALFAALAEANAVLIRSATKMDAEAIAAAPKLQVIARAGVGLDNVDIPAATKAGVMVVNAPTSNIISAAELTIGHILSLARHIPSAHASLAGGEWKRSKYTGVELFEKTLGIIGLGRIGALITARMQAFGMNVVAYDPYVTPARAQQLGVKLLPLDELLATADFITIHMPKTPETTGMIGAAQLQAMKPTAFVVNVARGGLIDEAALVDALVAGEIAGAGLDVFNTEPPTEAGAKLAALPNVSVTPHLGASTDEAQEKAGVAVARSVKLALEGDLVPDAVNVAGGIIDPFVRPGIALVDKLGQILAGLADGPVTSIAVDVRGELAAYDVKVYTLAALKGYFTPIVSDKVSYVNAPLLAEQRGLETTLTTGTESKDYRNTTTLTGVLADGRTVSVAGTLSGTKMVEKIIGVNGFELEVPIRQHHLVMKYQDKPGVIGVYGRHLGAVGINIDAMQVALDATNTHALSILTVSDAVPEETLAAIQQEIAADEITEIDVVEP